MSEKDEEFRYSLKIVDNIKHPANLEEAWANEMEEMMFKSLEHISIHNDDPSILLEWFESSGPWPERVWKRFRLFLNKIHPGKFERPDE